MPPFEAKRPFRSKTPSSGPYNNNNNNNTSHRKHYTNDSDTKRLNRLTSILDNTNPKYIIDTTQPWYTVHLPIRQCSLKELANHQAGSEVTDALFREAQQLLETEGRERQGEQGQWYRQQFTSRGTTSDKLASATVALSEYDFMFSLVEGTSVLFNTARSDSHNYEAALRALEVVLPKMLPPRPLRRFISQYMPTLPSEDSPRERKMVLMYWYIEDLLKRTYSQFLSLAEASMKDKLAVRREAWLGTIGKLLVSVTEGRPVIIAMLVDKLGDPNGSVGHIAYHLILDMLSTTSTNQAMLQSELERVTFMKNCPTKTINYCINIMNQLVFNKEERKLALKCVHAYLTLFKQMVLTETIDQSITTAIIVGLRRAFPYANADYTILSNHIDTLFILANTGNFVQRVSALSLLQQLLKEGSAQQQQHLSPKTSNNNNNNNNNKEHHKGTFSDRWYRAIYQLLLISPKQLPASTHLAGFFALLHKALRTDKCPQRVVSFIARLLQRCLFHAEGFVCTALLLVAEMAQVHTLVRALITSKSSVVWDAANNNNNNNIAAGSSSQQPPVATPDGDSNKNKKKEKEKDNKNSSSDNNNNNNNRYDPRQREPRFCRAHSQCLWILNTLTKHTHPAVVKISVLLLLGEEVVFDCHPLDDLTLPNFLQLFVEAKSANNKNNNNNNNEKISSQSTTTGGNKGVAVFRRTVHIPQLPSSNDSYFISAAPETVEVMMLFIHRYAVQRRRFLDGMAASKVKSPWHKTDISIAEINNNNNDNDILDYSEIEEKKKKKKEKGESSLSDALYGPITPIHGTADHTEEEDNDNNNKSKNKNNKNKDDDDDSGNETDTSDGFDDVYESGDDSIEWGSDDEDAYDQCDASSDDGNYNSSDEDNNNDDDDDVDNNILSNSAQDNTMDDGEDFDRIIDKYKEAPKRKKHKAEVAENSFYNARMGTGYSRGGKGNNNNNYRGRQYK